MYIKNESQGRYPEQDWLKVLLHCRIRLCITGPREGWYPLRGGCVVSTCSSSCHSTLVGSARQELEGAHVGIGNHVCYKDDEPAE